MGRMALEENSSQGKRFGVCGLRFVVARSSGAERKKREAGSKKKESRTGRPERAITR